MLRSRIGALAWTLLLTVFPVVGAPTMACAGEGPTAALVVDTGSSSTRYCVSLDASSVSGIHLIELAGAQHDMPYSLGFGGKAVCMLEGVGPTSDDCFEDYPDFWGYWRGDGSGGWTWSSTGAGSTKVSDGDVEGWSWGSGQDGSSHQAPPQTTLESVCGESTSEPASGKTKSGGGKDPEPPPQPEPPGTVEGYENDDGERERETAKKSSAAPSAKRKKRAAATEPEPRVNPTPSPDERAPIAAPSSGAPGGPPPQGVAAIGASVLLATAALVRARRRRSP